MSLRKKRIEILSKEIGPGMACFIRQYDAGVGDYTKERQGQQEAPTKEVVKEIYTRRK